MRFAPGLRRPCLFLLALLCMATAALDLNACSCVPNVRPCARFPSADAVFVGTVIEAEGDERLGNQAHVRVEEVFAGLDGSELSEVIVDGYAGGLSCGMTFKEGARLLFYAKRDEAGKLRAWTCSGTTTVDRASDDLTYLRGMVADLPFGRVFGQVRVWRSGEPLKDMRVTVRGAGGARETTTDSDGRYEFAGLVPGTYTMEMVSPNNHLKTSRSATVAAHGCTWINFIAKGKELQSFPPEMPPDETQANPPLAPCQASSISDAAFLGTVIGLEGGRGSEGGTPKLPALQARVQVNQVFHGIDATDSREALVHSDAPCLHRFQPGEQYLFYVDRVGEGVFYAGFCARMKPISAAQADLEYLRGLPTAPPGARIFGQVTQWPKSKGMKGVRIKVRGLGVKREARTDKEGQYALSGLAPGKYTVQMAPGGIYRKETREIEVHENGCVQANFFPAVGKQPPIPASPLPVPILRPSN